MHHKFRLHRGALARTRVKSITRVPRSPGVYLFKDAHGEVIYVGKAANLNVRVASYFRNSKFLNSHLHHHRAIEDMAHQIASVETIKTPTAIDALILEARLIKEYWPRYNVREKDQKSFLYVVITDEQYPRVELMRGEELGQARAHAAPHAPPRTHGGKFVGYLRAPSCVLRPLRVFGPFPHASAIRAALKIIRKIFPYSTCQPPLLVPPLNKGGKVGGRLRPTRPQRQQGMACVAGAASHALRTRPCFNYHIGLCPGVCIGAITPRDYKKIIWKIILFFEGKRPQLLRELKREMERFSKEERFEEATKARNQIRALEHIRDVAVITREPPTPPHFYEEAKTSMKGATDGLINIFGRLEGYDISNIGGKYAVGSMVVFERGEPRKNEYRLFTIKTVQGANDAAMVKEVLRRRFMHSAINLTKPLLMKEGKQKVKWAMPDLILVDGGLPQVNAARSALREFSPPAREGDERGGGSRVPILGIAKGPDRKRDAFVVTGDFSTKENLERIVRLYPHILKHLRDEAHRFARAFYRKTHRRHLKNSDLRVWERNLYT